MVTSRKLQTYNSVLYIKNLVFLLVFSLTIYLINGAEDYNGPGPSAGGDYDYDYYGDYEPLYDDNDYVYLNPGADDYYDAESGEQVQSRPKKDLESLMDLSWFNKSEANLAEPECEPEKTTVKVEATTECEPESTGHGSTTTATTTTTTTTAASATTIATSDATTCETPKPATTTCKPEQPSLFENVFNSEFTQTQGNLTSSLPRAFQAPHVNNDQEEKSKELRQLIQHLYIAQARVQLEASEIKKAQAIANEAQQQLEESANHVRAVTAALQNAQQEVASSAIRAQTAQLQLAAHDQLLFAARQDVDALSSQMVGLQAAEGIAQPKASFDIGALMEKLRQPLLEAERPTPVPSISQNSPLTKKHSPSDFYYDDEYIDY